MLQQLRFGRGVDNRKLKATGFRYRYTTRETVLKLAEHMRLHPVLRGAQEPYRYEREVEDFLRWSPHVRNPSYRKESRLSPGRDGRAAEGARELRRARRLPPVPRLDARAVTEAVTRAATQRAAAPQAEASRHAGNRRIRPRARRPDPSPKRRRRRRARRPAAPRRSSTTTTSSADEIVSAARLARGRRPRRAARVRAAQARPRPRWSRRSRACSPARRETRLSAPWRNCRLRNARMLGKRR